MTLRGLHGGVADLFVSDISQLYMAYVSPFPAGTLCQSSASYILGNTCCHEAILPH